MRARVKHCKKGKTEAACGCAHVRCTCADLLADGALRSHSHESAGGTQHIQPSKRDSQHPPSALFLLLLQCVALGTSVRVSRLSAARCVPLKDPLEKVIGCMYLSVSVLGTVFASVAQITAGTLLVGRLVGMSCQRPRGLTLNNLSARSLVGSDAIWHLESEAKWPMLRWVVRLWIITTCKTDLQVVAMDRLRFPKDNLKQ